MPPMPVPATTAQRSGSAPRSSGDAAGRSSSVRSMSVAAASATRRRRRRRPAARPGRCGAPPWVRRRARRRSRAPRRRSAPECSEASKSVIGAAAGRAATSVSHSSSTVWPAGVLTPRPVTATRGRPRWSVAAVVSGGHALAALAARIRSRASPTVRTSSRSSSGMVMSKRSSSSMTSSTRSRLSASRSSLNAPAR